MEEIMSNKMQWTKPQLIVLARGTAEEAVLDVCKQQEKEYPNAQEGPYNTDKTTCFAKQDNPSGNCGACSGVTGS
jgi:hypothetical protein